MVIVTLTKFINNTLVPILKPFDGTNPLPIVIMDNASIHHVEWCMQLNTTHKQILSYSLDLMPLEETFSYKKNSTIKENDKGFQTTTMSTALLAMAELVFGANAEESATAACSERLFSSSPLDH